MAKWTGMSFPDESFDSYTRSAMERALEEAWIELRAMFGVDPLDADAMRHKLGLRISTAARDGERDPKQLKLIALGIIERPGSPD